MQQATGKLPEHLVDALRGSPDFAPTAEHSPLIVGVHIVAPENNTVSLNDCPCTCAFSTIRG